MTNMNREEYLAWVAAWKATYKANSQTIHNLKQEIKTKQKAGESASSMQSTREYLRKTQFNLLGERAAQKVAAGLRWEAERLEREAA